MKVLLCTLINDFDDEISKLENIDVVGRIDSEFDIEYNLKELAKLEPEAIILNKYLFAESEDAIKLIKEIRSINKYQRFVILTGDYDKEFIFPLVNYGIYDFIIEDFALNNIKEILENPKLEFDFLKYELKVNVKSEKNSKRDITLPFVAKVIIKSVFKEIITFYSIVQNTKDIGMKYAEYLANSKKCKVLFLDYDFLNPSSHMYKSKDKNIYTLIDRLEDDEAIRDHIEESIKTYKKIDIMSAPVNYFTYYHTAEETFHDLLEKLRNEYDYIIVNVNPYLTDQATNAALKNSDKIYILSKARRNHDIDVTNHYCDLIANRISENIAGVIISNGTEDSFTSIEIESRCNRNVLMYLDEQRRFKNIKLLKHYYKNKLNREFKKLGR